MRGKTCGSKRKFRIFAAAIVCGSALALSACTAPVVQKGIVFDERSAPIFSTEQISRTEEEILRIFRLFAQKRAGGTISQKTDQSLKTYAARVTRAVYFVGADERGVDILNDVLSKVTEEDVNELTLSRLSSIYKDAYFAVGARTAAELALNSIECYYEIESDRLSERYEQSQLQFIAQQKAIVDAEKETFLREVSSDDLSKVLRTLYTVSYVFTEENFESVFTDREVLGILKAQNCTDLKLSKEGWGALFDLGARTDSESFFGEMLKNGASNGDREKIISIMNDVFSLLFTVQSKLTEEDVSLFRVGKRSEAVKAVFSRFDEDDWELFKRATDLELDQKGQNELAKNRFGEDYENYLLNVKTVSFDELRSEVEKDGDFLDALKGYAAGVSPAFTYGALYDRT